MAGLAKLLLAGRVTADPERSETPNGAVVYKFTIAVDQYRGPSRDADTGWHRCEVWGKIQALMEYVSKGDQLTVTGDLVQDNVGEGKDRKTYHVIKVQDIVLAPKGGKSDGERVRDEVESNADDGDDDDDDGW